MSSPTFLKSFDEGWPLIRNHAGGSGLRKAMSFNVSRSLDNAMFTCGQWRDDVQSQVRVMRVAPSRGRRGIGQSPLIRTPCNTRQRDAAGLGTLGTCEPNTCRQCSLGCGCCSSGLSASRGA
jgi:hypothetical protein